MADMIKNTQNNNTSASSNTQVKKNLSYEDKVIKKIAGIATDGIPGVLTLSGGLIGNITDRFRSNDDKTKGIDAEVGKKQVALDLNVICEYGKNVPQLFDTIITKVTAALKDMTGLELVEMNMHVSDVVSHEEFVEMQNKQRSDNDNNRDQDSQSYMSGQQQGGDNARVH